MDHDSNKKSRSVLEQRQWRVLFQGGGSGSAAASQQWWVLVGKASLPAVNTNKGRHYSNGDLLIKSVMVTSCKSRNFFSIFRYLLFAMSFISLCAFRRRGQASLRVGRRCCHHLSSQARFLLQMHVEEGGSRSHIDWSTYQPREGLKPPSLEQKRIVEEVCKQESNVRVDAVAGSGKTTTILHLASLFNRPIVALLYNARLKEETRAKKDSLGLKHLEVHSFHAFAVKFYKAFDAKDDTGLSRLIKEDPPPDRPFSFDLFIFDEVQDMTPELFSFVCKVSLPLSSPLSASPHLYYR